MDNLGLVLKITERCNINCTYCYYFNGKDQSYLARPKFISIDTINNINRFLLNGVKEVNLKSIEIGFHGGEPLLIKKNDFIEICETFRNNLGQLVELSFNLQTNGILIDKEWAEIFKKYNIDIGVSLDGNQEYNDKYRVDFKNIGTYDKVIKGINILKENNSPFGVLSVINPNFDAKKIYRHFVDSLEVNSFDFLFPDYTYDNMPPEEIYKYGDFIIKIFEEWIKDDKPQIKVRFLKSFMRILLGGNSLIYGIGASKTKEIPLITIRSDGELGPSDELLSTDPKTIGLSNINVKDISLKEFIKHPIFQEIESAQHDLPNECKKCHWENLCGGGGITNRFSTEKRFNNPSLYCSALQNFYMHLVKYLINAGFKKEFIFQNLSTKELVN